MAPQEALHPGNQASDTARVKTTNQGTTMPTLAEYREYWTTLHDHYVEANEMAREARGLVSAAYVAALAGNGQGPTAEAIEHAEKLERLTDKFARETRSIAEKALSQAAD